jgi:transposase
MLFFHAVCHSFAMICVGEALMICFVLSTEERAQVAQARRRRPQIAERCHYVLLNAEGGSVPQIAQRFARHAHPMRTWLQAYQTAGLPGLPNTPPPARPATKGQSVTAPLEGLLAQSPSHCGSSEEGWTVALLRDDLAQHTGDVSDATVRRQVQAGGWVYNRCATTVPHHAPTAAKKTPGWQQWSPPAASAQRNGP